tara:strand:- start:98 stop:811 length:714 start_codon:yes stop_codon:yes gene_type:complete
MSNFEEERYHDKVTCDFAEMIYKQMASIRYGLEFCCDKGNDAVIFRQALIKKEELDLNAQIDPLFIGCNPNPDIPLLPINYPFSSPGGCTQIRVSMGGRGGGSIRYVPCGEDIIIPPATTIQLTELAINDDTIQCKTICYADSIGITIIDSVVVENQGLCQEGISNCIEYTIEADLNPLEGSVMISEVEYTDCFGNPCALDKNISWGEPQYVFPVFCADPSTIVVTNATIQSSQPCP